MLCSAFHMVGSGQHVGARRWSEIGEQTPSWGCCRHQHGSSSKVVSVLVMTSSFFVTLIFFFRWLKYHLHLFVALLSFFLCGASLPAQGLFTCTLVCMLNRDTLAFALYLVVVIVLMIVVSGLAGSRSRSHFCCIQLQSHCRCRKLLAVWVIMKNVAAAGATSIKTPES